MEKVCRGCFAEWDNDYDKCPLCGWSPDKVPKEYLGWKTGDVINKRYLVGGVLCKTFGDEAVIWRVYDNVMGISCYALVTKDDDESRLVSVAGNLSGEIEETVVMSLKKMRNHLALIFSVVDSSNISDDVLNKIMGIDTSDADDVDADNTDADGVDIPQTQEIDREEALPSDSILSDDRYRVIDCIGIGGFGITYMCEDIRLRRVVAIKEYYPAEWACRDDKYVEVRKSNYLNPYRYGLQSFMKEIKITSKFIHTPHMVTVLDAFEENDTAYMVMEYILGISVGREIRTKGYKPYSQLEVAEIIFPVMDALEKIHDYKIIHSDISPGNIMLTEQREVYLIDMGAAKYNLASQPPLAAAFLKVDYAAPEQYRTAKEGKVQNEGPWTDIYALGATMYYLLTGTKPPDIIRRLQGEDTDLKGGLMDKVPIAWMELIQRTMELEPAERISSIPALRQLIRSIL